MNNSCLRVSIYILYIYIYTYLPDEQNTIPTQAYV